MNLLYERARPFWRSMLVASLWASLTVASSIGLLAFSGYLITLASFHPSIAMLSVAIVGVRFFGIARGGFRWLERMQSHATALRLRESFRMWFYERLELLAPMGLRHLRHGDVFHAFSRDVDQLEFLYVRVVAPPVVMLWISMGMLWGLSKVYCSLVWIFLTVPLVATLTTCFFSLVLKRWSHQAQGVAGRLQATLLEMLQGRMEYRILGTWGLWEKHLSEQEHLHNRLLARMNTAVAVMEAFMVSLGLFVALFSLLCMATVDVQSAPLWVASVLGIWAAGECIQGFPALALSLRNSQAAMKRLSETASSPLPKVPAPYAIGEGLLVQNLSFVWPDGEPLFQGFSLQLSPGQSAVLTGPSGCGKSTLAMILGGFLAPASGFCSLPGRRVAILEQFSQIFSGTLADNLRVAWGEATPETMDRVLQQVGLWDWACAQSPEKPEEAWVGEQGRSLSVGQRQRLAAARVLIAEAPLVILDEPAAHLDPESESHLLDVFLKDCRERQAVLLAIRHHTQFLSRFDQVVRMGGVND
ncbi:MAG TPA: thiol reductant ABC exporter subunit CydC [Fibrobacteraceae bacterium]|nr:thiol reductant ABC exporter subunit CydC [Fibrobacteraceae bacterium]